jgi:hypothetical protein
VSGVEELALYVVFAVPINVAALWVWRRLGLRFDFSVATELLTGTVSDSSVHNEIAIYFQRSAGTSAWTYLSTLATAFAIGSLFRRVVWTCRLDTLIPHLRLKHGWFYVLQGRHRRLPRAVLPYVDVMTRLPDKDGSQTRLFRGVVVDFEISSSGAIDSLTLRNAVRGSGRGPDFKWKDIPSSRLVIMGSTIHSVNITYLGIDQPSGSRHRARIWWRSFIFEEP